MDKDRLDFLKDAAKMYGFLLIKQPRVDRFALFSYRDGLLQEGEGFSLEESDVVDLLRYYDYKYPQIVPGKLFGPRPVRRTQAEKVARLEKAIEKLNSNVKIKGSYSKKIGNREPDGWYPERRKNKDNKYLKKRARLFKLLIIRNPYPTEIERYVVFDLSTGKIFNSEHYSCTIDDLKVLLDDIENGTVTL